jgi:hypothetical protein
VRKLHDGGTDKDEKKGFRAFFRKKKGKVTHKTFYDVLGVSPSAKHEEIRLRFLELAKLHHPDSGGSPKEFAEISTAWKVLGNKTERSMYDTKLQYTPEATMDAAGYDMSAETDEGIRILMNSGYLKWGSHVLPVKRWILVPLVWLGVEQVEGDSPLYRRKYPFSFWWTVCILLALRQLYVTLRDWRSSQGDDRPWLGLTQEARSKYAWRVLGLSIALSTLPLWYRKWDFMSKLVKDDERLAHCVATIIPKTLFWSLGWTCFLGPIVGAPTEFVYSHLNRKDMAWDSDILASLEPNSSRLMQVVTAAATMGVCVQRQRSQGVPLKFCGRAATIGILVGRVSGWLFSFVLVGNARRIELKQPPAKAPVVTVPAEQPLDQLTQLQLEVDQLRKALQQQQAAKVDLP